MTVFNAAIFQDVTPGRFDAPSSYLAGATLTGESRLTGVINSVGDEATLTLPDGTILTVVATEFDDSNGFIVEAVGFVDPGGDVRNQFIYLAETPVAPNQSVVFSNITLGEYITPTAAPVNDMIGSATPLLLSTPIAGTSLAATLDAGEVNYFGASGSVWFSFVPTETGPVTIALAGAEAWDNLPDIDGALTIFSGAAGAVTDAGLQAVGNSFTGSALQSSVSFIAQTGQTYYIQVAGSDASSGTFDIAANALSGVVITGFGDDTPPLGDNVTTDNTVTVSGLAPAGSLVTLYNGQTSLGTGTAEQDGSWSVTTAVLAVGDYALTATATPVGGTESDRSLSLVLDIQADITPPDPPALTLDPGSDSGVQGNNRTSDTTPTFTGTAELGSVITLYDTDGVTILGTATATDGTWSITTSPLAGGTHNVTAFAADAAGNLSVASSALNLTILEARSAADFPAEAPGFDRAFYLARYTDVAVAQVDPLQHYQLSGWHEGRDPNAVFSSVFYLTQNPDVQAAGIDPLTHYIGNGASEGRDPSVAFDSSAYLTANPDVAAAGINPLAHYIQYGQAEDRAVLAATPHPTGPQAKLVDAGFYYSTYTDVAAAGVDPTQHYQQSGWKEGRDPNGFLDTSFYLETYQDVANAGIDPARHYDEFGWKEGRDPGTGFDTSFYLASNADVAAAGIDPLEHYLIFGRAEGRDPVGVIGD